MDPRLKAIPGHCVNGEDFLYLQQTQAKFHGTRLGSSPCEGSATHPFNRQTATAETLEGRHRGERRKTLQELSENAGKTLSKYITFS